MERRRCWWQYRQEFLSSFFLGLRALLEFFFQLFPASLITLVFRHLTFNFELSSQWQKESTTLQFLFLVPSRSSLFFLLFPWALFFFLLSTTYSPPYFCFHISWICSPSPSVVLILTFGKPAVTHCSHPPIPYCWGTPQTHTISLLLSFCW